MKFMVKLTGSNFNNAALQWSCPVCSQGRLFVAISKDDPPVFYISCEECDTEWASPEASKHAQMAEQYGSYSFSRYILFDEVYGHDWEKFIDR